MSFPGRRRRFGALTAIAVALLGVGLIGAPAQAEPSGSSAARHSPELNFTVSRDKIGLPQPLVYPGDPAQIGWGLPGDPDGGTAEDVVVTIDVSGISAFADVMGVSCPGNLCSWPVRDIEADGFAGGLLELLAKPDAPLGTTGTARLTATSSNATIASLTVQVTVGTVELVVNRLPQKDGAEPGTSLEAPITVANMGSLPASGVELKLTTTQGLGFAPRFANCAYGTTDDLPSGHGRTLDSAVCRVGTPVEPGKRYRLSTSVGLDVKGTALFEFLDYRVKPLTDTAPTTADPRDGGSRSSGQSGEAPVLTLVPDGEAPPPGTVTEQGMWKINAANTADLAVTGDSVTAEAGPGTEVTLTAKLRNDGPATFDLLTSDDQIGLLVDIPEGTTAVKVPDRCRLWTDLGTNEPRPGAPQYMCATRSPFAVGQAVDLPFTLRVTEDAPATTRATMRTMSVNGGELTFDTHQANNTAQFTVRVKNVGGSGGAPGPDGAAGGNGKQPHTQTISAPRTAPVAPAPPGMLAATGTGGASAALWASGAALAAGAALLAATRGRGHRTAD
ncbi:hypothetical protein PUR57_18895 [Streptomyces sp. JV176]|uniref:hypothetical protein n=1 Tax=Streptomyces sp. JV176 TaxID=858630 RepID=UPI002E79CD13|nr:hypothetical protein [Streptomyces sp. JV176]MEE1800714.1 hypothetical protein [Streptomyces sp. JV176]